MFDRLRTGTLLSILATSEVMPPNYVPTQQHFEGSESSGWSLRSYLWASTFAILGAGGAAYAAGPPYNQICTVPLIGLGLTLLTIDVVLSAVSRAMR